MNNVEARTMNYRELFGQIAVRKGYCSRGHIRKALCRQRSLRRQGHNMLIGMILLDQGAVDSTQLIDILRFIHAMRTDSSQSTRLRSAVMARYPQQVES